MSLNDAQELFSLFFAIYFAMIIDRSHEMYKSWDTYNAWKRKSHNIKRLFAAWTILFIVPLLHFAILFILLGSIDVLFDMTISGILNVALIGVGSFF
jgi:putative alpha-1,2-mannosidase